MNEMNDELEMFFSEVGTDTDVEMGLRRTGSTAQPVSKVPDQAGGPIRAWAVSGTVYQGISQSLDKLPPGCYVPDATDHGIILRKHPLQTDTLIDLPDSKSRAVIEEIKQFQTLRPAFKQRGLLFKRGVLLWGPPGSGKTSTLHLLMRLIVDEGQGIALLVTQPGIADAGLQLIRTIEPERQVICIMEDIDGLVATYGIEHYLSLLDGEGQIDNVVFVATTNYPERLDKRLVDRPSRFDTVEYVGMPSPEARYVYLRHKEPDLPEDAILEMVAVSHDFSIAHLRELIILTQCFGRTIEEAAKRLTAHKRRKPSSERAPDAPPTGFAGQFTFPNHAVYPK